MIENLINCPPPISPRPPSTLTSKNQDSSNKAPVISPRVPNPISIKGTNDNNTNAAKEVVPHPPPRNFPSPDHQMVEFRNPNGPKWPIWSHTSESTVVGFMCDPIPPRLPNSSNHMSCEERHHKIVNDIISNVNNNQFTTSNETSPRPLKPPALSPRNPIVDVNTSINLGFPQSGDSHIFKYNSTKHTSKSDVQDPNAAETSDAKILKPSIVCPRGNVGKLNENIPASKAFNLEIDRSNKPTSCFLIKFDGEENTGNNSDDPPLIMPRPKTKDDQSTCGNSDSEQSSESQAPERPAALGSNNRKLTDDIRQDSIDEEPSEASGEKTSTPKSPLMTTSPELFARLFFFFFLSVKYIMNFFDNLL